MKFGDLFEYNDCDVVLKDFMCYRRCKLLKDVGKYREGATVHCIYIRYTDGSLFLADTDDEIVWFTSDYFSMTI